MGFYYLSIFSLILILAIYAVAIGLFRFVWVRILHRSFKGPIVWCVIAVILIAPWAEELWIAWKFGQACKDAGTFVHKKVQVEGFYDDTTGWGPRQLAASKYQYVESKDILHRRLLRVEQADNASRNQALLWYSEKNPGKERPNDSFLVHQISTDEQIVVSPNGTTAWRVTKIDRPTARYHYKLPNSHTPVAHKIAKHEAIVLDSSTDEVLGKYVRFSRSAPWFYVSFGRGDYSCDAPGRWPLIRGSFSIYRDVLQPAVQK